ncbi:protein-methionine-sulfoxide reductase catalytic subunit MsrP [Pseudanabaena sp. FACHB-1998]|uniref:protein-methionine-sulfoxide reductase catalytic subunit MsrP n=1 Tax=Pseudanabaena sp. FACHB-1998 TaxID=2692858 RepID=UPI001681B4C6|nr:protein-methionine-sulfoxide reductase catalytic subunit MsrP [Pseudanabaena sp. FACHB-1998]MBD2178470.1 protein-methionine-sulfoxide reductase catalytic subunit MsrP [Pseudanabaena sp. FACHB-1998]
MTLIKILPDWFLPENQSTSESVYLNRRRFLKKSGLGSLSLLGLLAGCQTIEEKKAIVSQRLQDAQLQSFNASRNLAFTLDRPLTNEYDAAVYTNFYEFSSDKDVWEKVGKFQPHPWTVEVTGLVAKPQKFAIEDLIAKMPIEERLYRHRCVEAWAMAVPWTGFPLKRLIELVEPQAKATHVKFTTFLREKEARRQILQSEPWPYTEGLTIKEAMNELAFMVVGIYGHELPKQHGAPIRLVLPWKYGYKSIKSIVQIEFTDRQPTTFWNTRIPQEYDFLANVNPNIPHPRWSQASERMLGTGDRFATQMYNGYAPYVANLYNT